MSTEAKVGGFVLAGLAFLGLAVFLLGDFTFERRYPIYVTFGDTGGLSEKAPVKLSGVEIGKVKAIRLEGRKAKAELSVRSGVDIYRDSAFSIGSTGIIGSKFLQIDEGDPASGVLAPGSTVQGIDPVSIEKALTKALASLQDLLGGFNGEKGKQGLLARNLNDTVSNVRNLTANLDEMFADTKPHLTKALARMDSITEKLDTLMARADEMMAAINSSKGPVGAMLHDEQMKADVKQTVSSLKETAGQVKDILGRVNQFRVFWNYDWRYENAISRSRGDVGVKIMPREDRYYYLGGANLGNDSDATPSRDYQRKNKIDGLLGFVYGPMDLGVGVIRSGGGARLTYTPFKDDPLWGRFSVMGQAYDFGRDRTFNSHHFTHPEYDVGVMARITRLIGVGARVEDLQEIARYQSWINVSFEDKDIAYLFGLTTFGLAGSKGRTKSK
ncbi:MAG TPA: MlaD family protein [Elusimicrobiota bacterium]|nr:MlaD family protein [Elusimicrobiota bacterium]